MSHKDYYSILGVSRKESTKGIRDAFRNLAKKYHPDKAGEKECARFRNMVEAYETLSDPKRRRHYDEELEEERAREDKERTWYNSKGASRPRSFERDIFGDKRRRFFSFSDFFDEFSNAKRGFFSEPSGQEVAYEVILSPREAEEGVVSEISFPTPYACPHCEGTGGDWPFYCLYCHGEGSVEREERVQITIPQRVRDGQVLEVPVERGGGVRQYILVHIRIS